MNKKVLSIIFLFTSLFFLPCEVFSQSLSSVLIFDFEVSESTLKPEDGKAFARSCIEEIRSWGVLQLYDETQAENADYIIRGKISRSRGNFVLTTETLNGKTQEELASVTESAPSLEALREKLFEFCINITQPIPFPNYLVGTWEASIPIEGSDLLCRLVFKSDRTVTAERYDTYEYQTGSVLKYEGFGRGNYTFFSRVQQGRSANATLTMSLTLEDALPSFVSINVSRLSLVFDSERTSFELRPSGLACGKNNGGASVYPQQNMAYTRFVKK
ncbi:MAG: hypothetical protein LBV20_02000 [Treponema sp.]|nr:hypothetical protein [Treponema sp.]